MLGELECPKVSCEMERLPTRRGTFRSFLFQMLFAALIGLFSCLGCMFEMRRNCLSSLLLLFCDLRVTSALS